MSQQPRIPTPRCLDIYRLVVAKGLTQCDVADSFGVSQPRIAQIVSRVRSWVDRTIGDWLFPGRDDFRFYVALQSEQIRFYEQDEDPQAIEFIGLGWTYSRRQALADFVRGSPDPARFTAADSSTTNASDSTTTISTEPIIVAAQIVSDSFVPTPSGPTDYESVYIRDLALILAKFLIDWKKSRSLTSAFRQPS